MWLGALLPIVIYGVKGCTRSSRPCPDITLQWNASATTSPRRPGTRSGADVLYRVVRGHRLFLSAAR